MNKRSLILIRTQIIILLLVSIHCETNGQDSDKQIHKKNSLQIEGATLKFFGMYSVTYEHLVLSKKTFNLYLSSGFGGWYFIPVSQKYYGLSFNKNSDKGIPHFYPLINIGYRYHNPAGKGLVFRSYIGVTGIGIGIGKAF